MTDNSPRLANRLPLWLNVHRGGLYGSVKSNQHPDMSSLCQFSFCKNVGTSVSCGVPLFFSSSVIVPSLSSLLSYHENFKKLGERRPRLLIPYLTAAVSNAFDPKARLLSSLLSLHVRYLTTSASLIWFHVVEPTFQWQHPSATTHRRNLQNGASSSLPLGSPFAACSPIKFNFSSAALCSGVISACVGAADCVTVTAAAAAACCAGCWFL